MKRTFAVVACLLALSFTKADHFKAFEDGKRYIYEYKTRVATGIAEDVKQFSGFGFTGRVTAQSAGDHVVYQMSDLKLGYFNEKMDHIYDEMHIDYQKISDNREGHINNLEKAFWVEYDHGSIKAIYFTEGEDVAKHNNKKALASLFQLYLEDKASSDLNVYKREEDGIGGICSTTYIIGHYDKYGHEEHQTNVLNVTKYRDYENCSHRPYLFYSSILGERYTNDKPLTSASTVRYSVKGTRDHYTIEEIQAAGAIDFTPFSTNGRSIVSVVNQTLHLIKVEDAEQIEKPSNLVKETTLYYEYENDRRDYKNVDLKQAHYFNRVYPFTDSTHVEKANLLYVELVQALKNTDAKLAEFIPKFYDVLVQFDYDDFEKFFADHLKPEPSLAEKFLLELLPFLGTNPAILYSFHIIEEAKIPASIAYEIIKYIPFYVKEPSQKLIEAAKEFTSKAVAPRIDTFLITSALAYGTLLFKACQEHVFNPHPHDSKHYVSDEKCTEYIQELVDKFNSVPEQERSLYLRAIANTRSATGTKLLISVLKGNYNNILKEIAIWGAFLLHDPAMKEINTVMLSILDDPGQDYILRGYAFEYLLFFNPSPQYFSNILLLLEKDPSTRLKSYIYAALNNYANATHEIIKPHAHFIQLTLKYIEKQQTDIIRTPLHHLDSFYNNKYNFGEMFQFTSIPSHESAFPRALYLGESVNLLGYMFQYISFGFTAEGQLFDERYLKFKYIAKHISTNEFIKKTMEKFKLKPFSGKDNQYELFEKVFFHDVYATNNIMDLMYTLDESRTQTEDGNHEFHVHTIGYTDVELLIPNELGMPVSLRSRTPYTAQSDVHLENPYITFPHTIVKTHLRAGLFIDTQVAVLSVLYGPIGYKLTTESTFHLPIYLDVKGGQKMGSEVSLLQQSEPFDVFKIKSVPKTIGMTDLEIHYSPKPVQKKISGGHEYLGVGLTLNFTYDSGVEDRRPPFKFLKSVFEKAADYETPQYLSERMYSAVNAFFSYYFYNPTASAYALNIQYSQAAENPTNAFTFSFQNEKFKKMDEAPRYIEDTYSAEIIGKGLVERKWEVNLKTKNNIPEDGSNSETLQFKRSALPGYDNEPYEICYSSESHFTDFTEIFKLHPVLIAWMYDADVLKGKDCTPPKVAHIKAKASRSEEQKMYNYKNDPAYKKCHELAQKGFPNNPHCGEYIANLGRLDELHIDISYKDIKISNKTKSNLHRLYQMFRYKFYNYFNVDHFHGSGQESHTSIIANVSYLHPEILDLQITRPDHTVYYNNVNIRKFLPNWEPYTVLAPVKLAFAKTMLGYNLPFCVASGSYVATFDGVTYKAPLSTTNYHLAFTNSEDIFVFFRSVKNKKYGKAFRFYYQGEMVQIEPTDDTLVVTVNGEPQMTKGEDFYIHKIDEKDVLTIYKYAGWTIVTPKDEFLSVFYDGTSVFMGASNLYKQSQHGICGNFDNEKQDEFEGPDKKIYDEAADFVHSYEVEE